MLSIVCFSSFLYSFPSDKTIPAEAVTAILSDKEEYLDNWDIWKLPVQNNHTANWTESDFYCCKLFTHELLLYYPYPRENHSNYLTHWYLPS